MDVFGWVFVAVVVVLVVGFGAVGVVLSRRHRRAIAAEFTPLTDEQLLTGLLELRRAVALQRQSEQARDMHVRHWR